MPTHITRSAAVALGLMAAPLVAAEPIFDPNFTKLDSTGFGAAIALDFDNDGRSEFFGATTRSDRTWSSGDIRMYRLDPLTHQWSYTTIVSAGGPGITPYTRFGGDLAAADMNGDGYIDLIVPNSDNGPSDDGRNAPGAIYWYQNPGDGNVNAQWTPHLITTWPGGNNGTNSVVHMSEIEAGDIDGDGDIDIVARDVYYGVNLLRNDGNGTWTRKHIPTRPREGLALFDPDNDGDLDLAINGRWIEIPGAGGTALDLSLDFNLHAYDNPADDTTQPGGGNQYPPQHTSSANLDNIRKDYAAKVAVGDLNGDGRPDIVVANAEELEDNADTQARPKGIRLYMAPEPAQARDPWQEIILTNTAISAPAGVNIEDRFSLHTLQIADIDGDGDLDIVSGIADVGVDDTTHGLVGGIFALLNDGAANFTYQSILEGTASNKLFVYNNVLGDADGDGDLDLFGASAFHGGDVRYFENITPEPATAALLLISALAGLVQRRRR